MTRIEELRQPSARRLLEIWRETGETAEEPLERGLLCNAQVLAESCLCQGSPVFTDGEDVLGQLSAGEMEELLCRLAEERPDLHMPSQIPWAVNQNFDRERFQVLKEA